jgi:hypothetical protein
MCINRKPSDVVHPGSFSSSPELFVALLHQAFCLPCTMLCSIHPQLRDDNLSNQVIMGSLEQELIMLA